MAQPDRRELDLGIGGYWIYELLAEPRLSSELARLSFSKTIGDTDCVTFQPCPDPDQRSQDRYIVQDLNLSNGVWKLRCIMDGHAGHETADHVVDVLPSMLRAMVAAALEETPEGISAETISEILKKAIATIDDEIKQAVLDIFPDVDALAAMSDDEIKAIINDGGETNQKVLRCMRGTTVLVALIDPNKENLWVASLGDCQAALGVKTAEGTLETRVLSSNHNGVEADEADRIRKEHPGEEECMLRDRVLGAIAVTRALGDHEFKLPAIYTLRLFLNSEPGFRLSSSIHDIMKRNLTPPYVSHLADVQHAELKGEDAYLVLCSDGLLDLYETPPEEEQTTRSPVDVEAVSKIWLDIVTGVSGEENRALVLLREAMGGKDDLHKISRLITAEMAEKWMDDTTILVQRL
ncbi:protein serine threonine phosphatase 2C [Mycena floridula]|nr:protein serine threonine phosphatase 2C [Mycena floridula]